MFGADISMVEIAGFLCCQGEYLFGPRGIRNITDQFLIRAAADLLFNFHADSFEIESELLKHIDGDALSELDQAEQQVLRADEIVVEAVGFLSRQSEHLLRPWRKIVHGFIAHTSQCNYF